MIKVKIKAVEIGVVLVTLLIFVLLLGFMQTAQAAEPVVPTCGEGHSAGMVSYWKAEGDASDYYDGNHGSFVGNANANAAGKVGQAFSFDGNGDYIVTNDITEIDGQSKLTIAFWMNPDLFEESDGIVTKFNSDWNRVSVGLDTRTGTQGLALMFGNGSNTFGYTSTEVVRVGEWHHYVAVFDGTQPGNSNRLKLYYDGSEISLSYYGTIPSTTASNSAKFEIGRENHPLDVREFDGKIDEVAILNRALTPEEIEQMYINGQSGYGYCDADKTPPTTTIALSGTLGNNGWYVSDVEVTLTAVDNEGGSGVFDSKYSFDGTNWNIYTIPFTISTEGTITVYYRSTDNAGNVETTKEQMVKIDKTAPIITITTPTAYGLYTVGVALDFSATDSVSGVATVVGTLTNTTGDSQEGDNGYIPDPGVYTLVVSAIDAAGNTEECDSVFFVVYDPEGGFATGGGWFYPDPESTLHGGKANFGFVARYKQGGSAGNLEFQYQDAGINLKSTSIDWLVISAVSAQFQGTGTINGEGLYTFRVMAKDNGEPGVGVDHFDIKIWDGTDTEADPIHKAKNVLDGGNIVVHKK
jgi:hypothetical protein